ncbi:unnamed protein product [Bathycoccus prasinos]
MTTILTNTKNNEREDSDDATSKITIFVKLLPEPNNEEHKNLTRFQVRDSRSKYLGKTCVFRDVEKNKETISELKRKVERETGEKVETLRRGCSLLVLSSSKSCARGTPEGVILEDEKTLEECGITRSMGLFEYLWVDSAENQEKYKEEKERMYKILPNHEKFLEEYAKENPGKGNDEDLDDEFLERGAPNKNSKLLQGNAKDAEYFKDAEEIQAKVEKELEEYNAKEDEEREKMFGKGDRKE